MTDEDKKKSVSDSEFMPNPEEPVELKEEQDSEADDLKPYPLRKPSEDPKWAVRTVRIWIGLAFAFLAFILILGIFGLFYD